MNRLMGDLGLAAGVRLYWYCQPVTNSPASGIPHRAHQRLGQYMCNQLLHPGLSWPELFYCTDSDRAWQMVVDEYTKESM